MFVIKEPGRHLPRETVVPKKRLRAIWVLESKKHCGQICLTHSKDRVLRLTVCWVLRMKQISRVGSRPSQTSWMVSVPAMLDSMEEISYPKTKRPRGPAG